MMRWNTGNPVVGDILSSIALLLENEILMLKVQPAVKSWKEAIG